MGAGFSKHLNLQNGPSADLIPQRAGLVTEELFMVVTVKHNWCTSPILPSDWMKRCICGFLGRVG